MEIKHEGLFCTPKSVEEIHSFIENCENKGECWIVMGMFNNFIVSKMKKEKQVEKHPDLGLDDIRDIKFYQAKLEEIEDRTGVAIPEMMTEI